MTKMMNVFAVVAAVAMTLSAQTVKAQRIELGIGAGTTHALADDSFKSASKTGDAVQYFLGYGFDKNWGAELGYDVFDFDGTNSKNESISLAGTYRFLADYRVHPIAKLGLGALQSKNFNGDKANSLNGKAALGLEADFTYVSVGALFNYIYGQKMQTTAGEVEKTQSVIPALFVTFHNAVDYADDKKSESVAPAPVVVAKPVDTDGDGVVDADDKCPKTPAGVAVNGYGCALTEKASVKLQVEFASGKSVLDAKFDSEIKTLADFMAKYPNTSVEIAGHTDNVGKEASNKSLSAKRAEAVKKALIAKGVDAKRLTSKGYGSAQPVADNKTAEGRQANRRVVAEISVTQEKKK